MLDQAALDLLFNEARSHNDFDPTPVPEEKLHALYDLMKLIIDLLNCTGAYYVFHRSNERVRLYIQASNSSIKFTD